MTCLCGNQRFIIVNDHAGCAQCGRAAKGNIVNNLVMTNDLSVKEIAIQVMFLSTFEVVHFAKPILAG